ncbi:MAG: damage-inducible protein [Synechococcaceae bacterium WB8_1B_136]|nr:damage-inducible protein [Synechococcaceae bacterium WB8_1B_136]
MAERPVSTGIQLTPGQQGAAEAFSAWLQAPCDGTPFVLSGYAGTGKTTLCAQLLALVEATGLCWTVVAPTHKAVGVIRQQLAQAGLQATWFPSTIHRLLRLKLKRQGDLERCEETEQTAGSLENLGLVLVDEASMVDSTLLEIALRCAHPFRTRLVFVGDPGQLPPVGEPQSPVFAMGRAVAVQLTEVVRHQGPVLQLATGLRTGLLPCRQPPAIPAVRDAHGLVAMAPRQQWLAAAQAALRRAVELDNPDHARILCYTNKALEQLVPLARRAIHGAMADQLPVLPGEVLITRSAVMAPACRSGEEAAEEPDMVLGSNRELVVRDVSPERCDLADFGVGSGDGCIATVIDTLTAEVEAGETRLALRLLPPAGSGARRDLDAVLQRLRQQAREAGKSDGRGLWRRYFLVRDAFASLGPAAVLTVHRSQGSTFGEVYVAGDVFWPSDPVLRRQLVYVAVSRASQAVWLVADPRCADGGADGGAAERERWLSALAGPQCPASPDSPPTPG